ncbi:unnamed protein product, partial [Ixodes hexagonus]
QAPIDPLQLLKALSPLLSAQGGIRSSDEVSRLSSLMKKFSRKLVSRCIYCNVLRATSSDILEVFLDLDGWSTIHMWLQEAKTADNRPFLVELLKLCQVLPMSLERLKENSSPKLIKGLTKCSSEEVRLMAEKVVTGWMKLIKGDSKEAIKPSKDSAGAKKKKKTPAGAPAISPKGALKRERSKGSQDETSQEQTTPKGNTTPVHPSTRPTAAAKDSPPTPKESPIAPKKPKPQDRPKTVKTFQTRFRSTGLEEAPLPPPVKAGAKKVVRPPVDKNALLSARQRLAPTIHAERRVKPSSLVSMGGDGKEAAGPGIRLIAPKPVHVLQEDGGFMDALTALPVVPAVPGKRKRKTSAAGGPAAVSPTNAKEKGTTPPPSNSPTSPPPTAPKFQFYKDTLETGEGAEGAEGAEEEEDIGKRVKRRKRGQAKAGAEEVAGKEDAEESAASPEGDSPPTPTGEEEEEGTAEKEKEEEAKKEEGGGEGEGEGDSSTASSVGTDRPASILSMTRKKMKKSVRWAEESKLKQFHFFDMDETERVNVNNMQNFGDLKTLEMKRERQVVETARRMMGDRMEEALPYRMPRLLERPEPLAVPGSGSLEKEVQKLRQQKTLQEIYFSKDMIPDSPYEPDAEQVSGQEPKQIPLEDENSPSATLDYSNMEVPKASSLPSILSNLVLSIASKTQGGPQGLSPQQGNQAPQGNLMHAAQLRMPGQPQQAQHQGPMQGQMPPQSMMQGDMQGPPMHMGGGGGNLLGGDPQCQNGPPSFMHPNNMQGQGMNMMGPPVSMPGGGGFPNMGMPMGPGGGNGGGGGGDWGMMPPMGGEGDFFRGPPPGMGGGGPPMGMGGGAPPPMGSAVQHMMDMARGNMAPHGGRNSRMRTPRIPCKYYMTSTCRFGSSCSFLHPGVNGPPLQ